MKKKYKNKFSHPITSCLYTAEIERIGDLDQILFKQEAFWGTVCKFKTLVPHGLNVDFNSGFIYKYIRIVCFAETLLTNKRCLNAG